MVADDDLRLVLVTAPDDEHGRELARRLVGEGLAACVNIVPGVTSVYRWQGTVEEDREVLLVIKSSRDRAPALEAWLANVHPYDVPECIHLKPDRIAAAYREWWSSSLGPPVDLGEAP